MKSETGEGKDSEADKKFLHLVENQSSPEPWELKKKKNQKTKPKHKTPNQTTKECSISEKRGQYKNKFCEGQHRKNILAELSNF